MNWNNIWESTISGIFVVIFGGISAWLAYILGIRGKEKSQIASRRKQEIYIPLKYEMKTLMEMNDIWTKLGVFLGHMLAMTIVICAWLIIVVVTLKVIWFTLFRILV